MTEHPTLHITHQKELDAWLRTNHATAQSVWLVYYKPTTGKGDLTYDTLVDTLLCYGWIDSLPRKVDAERTSIRISPRNPKSNWSRRNKEKIARLSKAGRLHQAGKAMVALAKKNGTWTALDEVENLTVPPDLAEALRRARAAARYERQSRSVKRGFLEQLLNAKKPETRAKLIEKHLAQLPPT